MTDKPEKPRISGKEATDVAMEAENYGPVRICAADDSTLNSKEPADPSSTDERHTGRRSCPEGTTAGAKTVTSA